MPRNAAAAAPAAPTTTPLEELLDRGRSQGHLSLDEVRKAFHDAGITPAQGRSIIRELTDTGVRLASEDKTEAPSTKKKGTGSVKKAPPAKPARSKAKPKTKATRTKATRSRTTTTEARPAEPETRSPETEPLDTEQRPAANDTATAAVPEDFEVDAPTDLDDQSSVMGDSVHTYLKSIGRRPACSPPSRRSTWPSGSRPGLFAEHKLESEPEPGRATAAEDLRARRRGRPPRQGPHAGGQPPAGGLGRQEVHRPRPVAARRRAGGQPRPDPRGREVRLHQGLQVLHVRHVVDPAGHPARLRRLGPDDPAARCTCWRC